MKKRHTKRPGKFSVLILFALVMIGISFGLTSGKHISIIGSNAVELSYKAKSPIGDIGGVALPASCESNAWNNNGGYHLDGITTDPGNCAAVVTDPNPPVVNHPPVMTHLVGSIRVPVNQNVGSWEALGKDQDGDNIAYQVKWGDDPIILESKVVKTDTPATLGHVYTKIGTYTVKARAVETSKEEGQSLLGLFVTKVFAQPEGLSSDWIDFTVEVYDGNASPEMPVIAGDIWTIVNQSTSNTIVAKDPDGDDIYYELDWNYTGTFNVEGTTNPATGSEVVVPIGHTYSTVGTYTVKGRAVQANDPTKKSGLATYTIRVAPIGGDCSAPANACGATNGSVVGGQCVAPGLPAGYGDTCNGPANVCNMTTGGGTIGCDGTCSDKSAPSNTLCGCTGTANICGMTNTGNYNAAGNICLASTPSNTACSCTSGENACGMTNTGNYNAAGTACDAAVPADALCPLPGIGTTINDFRASPKLLALNKTSKLYWDISGNRRGCSISYTKTPGGAVTSVLASVGSGVGQIDTTPITEKRYYHLTCGAVEREAIVSPYSLTEI